MWMLDSYNYDPQQALQPHILSILLESEANDPNHFNSDLTNQLRSICSMLRREVAWCLKCLETMERGGPGICYRI